MLSWICLLLLFVFGNILDSFINQRGTKVPTDLCCELNQIYFTTFYHILNSRGVWTLDHTNIEYTHYILFWVLLTNWVRF